MNNTFYGWIPTNRTILNFSFITLPTNLNLKKEIIDIFFNNTLKFEIKFIANKILEDSYGLNYYSKTKHNVLPTTVHLVINNNNTSFVGNIKFFIKEELIFSCKFNISLDGIVCFSVKYIKKFDNFFLNEEELKQGAFNILKLFVHGDAHHHQKIDISLPITNKKENLYNIVPEYILNTIKLMERNIKINKDCKSSLKNQAIEYEAEGYISYLNIFLLLFPTQNKDKIKTISNNILISIKNILNKRKLKNNFKSSLIAKAVTFFGIFISINILLNAYWFPDSNDLTIFLHPFSRENFIYYSIILLIPLFFFFYICEIVSSLFYKYYEIYEIFYFIKYSKFTSLNIKGKIVKLLPFTVIFLKR